eukprot:14840988-Alexandrium_andersonii.AAC.1
MTQGQAFNGGPKRPSLSQGGRRPRHDFQATARHDDRLPGGHEAARENDGDAALCSSPGAIPSRGRHYLVERELARPDCRRKWIPPESGGSMKK